MVHLFHRSSNYIKKLVTANCPRMSSLWQMQYPLSQAERMSKIAGRIFQISSIHSINSINWIQSIEFNLLRWWGTDEMMEDRWKDRRTDERAGGQMKGPEDRLLNLGFATRKFQCIVSFWEEEGKIIMKKKKRMEKKRIKFWKEKKETELNRCKWLADGSPRYFIEIK